MFELTLIVCALMRGQVVAVRQRKNGVEYRFSLCHFGTDGTICQLNDCGQICYYRNIFHVFSVLKRKKSVSYDAAIIDDVKQEQEFLAGREAAAKLIDPPPFLKIV